ncbi:MAG: DUF1749 domain-containing protein [Candidatus Marsarchaeota archaeon]|nr:DUF1749 domain-containing protein [Candidatus Marsarchaeota archaeon]
MGINQIKHPKHLECVDILSFDASDGLILYSMLSKPKGVTDKVILHIHGLGGSFYGSNSIPEISAEAKRRGIAFMSQLTRGSYAIEEFGYRSGNRKLLAGSALERFEDCVYDIDGAIRSLRKMGFKKIFLEGHSTGCQKILYYMNSKKAKNSKFVTAMALISPVDDHSYDLYEMGKKSYFKLISIAKRARGNAILMPTKGTGYMEKLIGPERFLSTADLKNPEAKALYYDGKLDYVAGLKKPLFVAFGENDELMKEIDVRKATDIISKAYAGKKFRSVILKGTGHTFKGRRKGLAKALLKFYSSI